MSERGLYGGAMITKIPERLVDVSQFRQIPNHQEVFAHAESDTSVVIELNQFADDVADSTAAQYYFTDLAKANQALQGEIVEHGILSEEQIPGMPKEHRRMFYVIGTQLISKFNESKDAANQVLICMAILRLPHVQTDILISVNGPMKFSQTSSSKDKFATSADDTIAMFREVVATFSVKNWGLFVPQ